MKIVLVPYILICWLLLRFGVVKRSLGNFIAMGLGGVLLLFMLFTFTRFYAVLDLTGSSTVKAPHIVLNSPAGGEIDKIFVTHNQKVKAGDSIYSFKTDRYEIALTAKQAELSRLKAQLDKLRNDLKRLEPLRNDVVSQAEYDNKQIEVTNQRELVIKATQDISDLQWKIDHALVQAPTDGQVNVIYASEGQYFGEQRPSAILMFTNKKFIEMRIPDQSYAFIKPQAFAEFYVDAYPGKIFRARVQSVTESTGEAQGSLLSTPQSVTQQVMKNSNDIGRTVILEFEEPAGVHIPIGATGQAWIAAEKPVHILGFLDVIAGMLLRFAAAESYLKAL
ncbi:HlyD family secretion protein [Hydromonas duriensis]|uniref:RND family efflux transporter MFP subunit n=1 Tax=Hydromonas duriensis TaxID=1527608 RepID=A0A4R6Y2M6_9BURK|nr:HlyD family efflux transporter periplasmic adaptor subunit [Hydromonas duriensis]TDR30763.1 RND family efflux transporter MFP subunit [Hydromonas duriensis]